MIHTGEDAGFEVEAEDPLEPVCAGDLDLKGRQEKSDDEVEEVDRGNFEQASHLKLRSAGLDAIGLTLTLQGKRKLLGRKPEGRAKPLLAITCTGCGQSSQDPDEIIKED